jgi:hypothetical protein
MSAASGEEAFAGTARFVITRCLGQGGMGVVYEVHDRERKAQVALKTLRRLEHGSVEGLKKEFGALANLDHPNLVRLHELLCEDGRWFFTMELVEGLNFLSYVRTEKGWNEARLRATLGQLADALATLHQSHRVHRDLKPENVLVDRHGRVVVLDLGLVKDLGSESQSSSHGMVGTAAYMAPEQASGLVGPEADWYSLGVMLFEALTGRLPFCGSTIDMLMNKQTYEPPAPRGLVTGIPQDLDALCVDLLHREPEARPTGEAVLQRLGVGTVSAAPGHKTQLALFVGRRRELGILHSAYDRSRGGGAVSVWVRGESGLGKTTLVRHFLETLEDSDHNAVVLPSRCYERESAPYKAWGGIMDGLAEYLARLDPVRAALILSYRAPVLARIFPVLQRIPAMARMLGKEPPIPSPHELRARAFSVLREILGRLAEQRPLVLFTDDLQWADADSLALLSDVMRAPLAPALLFIATIRTDAGPEVEGRLATLAERVGGAEALHLGSLSEEEAHELAAQLLGGTEEGARELSREAEGHPLFLYELARQLESSGPSVPGTVRLDEVLWGRASRLEGPARRLLEMVAVAGAPVRLSTLAYALESREAQVARRAALLRAANLVRTASVRGQEAVSPYHDRVREAVLARLDAESQKMHHHSLAHALEREGAAEREPQVLVRHLLGAGYVAEASTQAARAADRAAEMLAFDQAAELYRTVLRLGEQAAEGTRQIRIRLGDALVHTGRGAEAAEILLLAAEGADVATRVECQRRAAEQLLSSGHIERGMTAMASVLAEMDIQLAATPMRALLSVIWHRLRIRLHGLTWKERSEASFAARELTHMDVYRGAVTGLSMVDNIRGADLQARSLLLALQKGEPRRIARALYHETFYVGSQGGRQIRRAASYISKAEPITRSSQDPYLVGWDHSAKGVLAYYAGDFVRAAERFGEGEAAFRDRTTGTAWELGTARHFRLSALRHMGAFRELKQGLDEYLRDAAYRGDRYTETTLARSFNMVWLVKDDPAAARKDLDRRTWTPPASGYHVQHWYDLRARAELALYEGRGGSQELWEGFAGLARSLLLRVQIFRTESRWLHGRLALAAADAGGGGSRRQSWRMAEALSKERIPYAAVWASLLFAGAMAGTGARAQVREHLCAALAGAEAQSMQLCANAARRRLGELIGGTEGAQQLARADAWMEAQGIENAQRMAEIVAPGFAGI